MHEEELNGGFLTNAADTIPRPDGDPLAAVLAVAAPRAEADPVPREGDDSGRENAGGEGPDGERPSLPEGEEYGDFDWPDGYVADPKAMAKFIPLARTLGLPREGAQKLAGLYTELDQEKQRAQAEFIAKNNAEWLREIHRHPEFGGHNLQRTTDNVAGTMRRFGSPLLLAQVRQMNIQNWPEMFFFLARVSQAVSEDCSPSGGNADAPAKSTAQLLFPGLK